MSSVVDNPSKSDTVLTEFWTLLVWKHQQGQQNINNLAVVNVICVIAVVTILVVVLSSLLPSSSSLVANNLVLAFSCPLIPHSLIDYTCGDDGTASNVS